MFQSQLVEPHEDILLNAVPHPSFGRFNQCHHSLAFGFTLQLVSPWPLDGLQAPTLVSKDKDFSPVKILRRTVPQALRTSSRDELQASFEQSCVVVVLGGCSWCARAEHPAPVITQRGDYMVRRAHLQLDPGHC